MTDEDTADHWLLDLLCSCADNGVRVTYIRQPMRPSLERLRRAGLVAHDSLIPSPTAQIAWYVQKAARVVSQFSEPAEAEPTPEPTPEPPPKPKRRANPSIVEKAKRWEAKHKSAGAHTSAGAPGDSRAASSGDSPALRGAAAPGLPDEAPLAPAVSTLRPWSPPVPPKQDNVIGDVRAFRQSANRRASLKLQAEKLVDSGKTPGFAPLGAVRTMMKAVVEERAHAERSINPAEQAKLYLQQRRIVVFKAEVREGPKGHYYVGNTLMSEAEMVAYADRMRERAA